MSKQSIERCLLLFLAIFTVWLFFQLFVTMVIPLYRLLFLGVYNRETGIVPNFIYIASSLLLSVIGVGIFFGGAHTVLNYYTALKLNVEFEKPE